MRCGLGCRRLRGVHCILLCLGRGSWGFVSESCIDHFLYGWVNRKGL